MTVVVTRNVQDRYRGFLTSCMLEIAPGVYTSPRMNASVRKRIQDVISKWHGHLGQGSIVMTWQEARRPEGQGVFILGEPPRSLYPADGVLLTRLHEFATTD